MTPDQLNTILEAAELACSQLEQEHGKCDMSGDLCSEAWNDTGEDDAKEHALYRRFSQALAEVA